MALVKAECAKKVCFVAGMVLLTSVSSVNHMRKMTMTGDFGA